MTKREEKEWKSRTKVGRNRKKSRRVQTMTSPSSDIAKKTRNIVGTSRAYSNGRDKKDKCSG